MAIDGPGEHTADYGLSDIPMFVREGAIIPMKTMESVGAVSPDPLVWAIYPGTKSQASIGTTAATASRMPTAQLYEDDGESLAYREAGAGARINCSAGWQRQPEMLLSATVSPVSGGYSGMPASRGHVFQFRGLGAAAEPKEVQCGPPGALVLCKSPACSFKVLPAPGTLADPAGSLEIRAGRARASDGIACAIHF